VVQPLIPAVSLGLGAPETATGQYGIHPAPPELVENALLGWTCDPAAGRGRRDGPRSGQRAGSVDSPGVASTAATCGS
jgi:hypothetical protein